MRPALAAAALALLCACAGYTKGETLPGDGNGIPIGLGGSDAGDAGPDGGSDGGDAGPDGGCVALSLGSAGVIDGCALGATGTASVSVNASNCVAIISGDTTYSSCSGTATGSADSFLGTCSSLSCSATSLPGSIVCSVPGGSSCTVTVCDGGC